MAALRGRSGEMPRIDKKQLSERDICTKFITPALTRANWDLMNQIREEVAPGKGEARRRII